LNQKGIRTWENTFNSYQTKLFNELRQITGYYNITDIKEALIVQDVPKAKAALKAHPNDPKLCMVMNQLDKDRKPEMVAKQIAFIDVGNQYCTDYYHRSEAWGITQASSQGISGAKNKYARLSYAKYYHGYVIPLVPDALKKFEDKNNNQFICAIQGIWKGARDPMRDAIRVAYRGQGKHYCPKLTPVQEKDYLRTSYACVVINQYFCDQPNHCDVFERCKPMNGILFKN